MDVMKELADALKNRMKQLDALEDRVRALEEMLTTDSKVADTRTPLTFPKIDASALSQPKHPFEPFFYTERN